MKNERTIINKDGFTLVELLGVFAVLAIVMGLAVVGYVNINGNIKKSYYNQLEESMAFSAGEYYTYHKNEVPTDLGEEKKVDLGTLISDEYIEEIKDQTGKKCNSESYVKVTRDINNKLNYNVCLVCGGEYESITCNESSNIFDINVYGTLLKEVSGSYIETNTRYREGTYVNKTISLHVITQEGVKIVLQKEGEELPYKEVEASNLENNIFGYIEEVSESGTYLIYGERNGKKTEVKRFQVLIDKENPTYIIEDHTERPLYINSVTDKKNVNVDIKEISDQISGIAEISYSLDLIGENKNININKNETSFNINKDLGFGTYLLIVNVVDNAGNETYQEITYNIDINSYNITYILNGGIADNPMTYNSTTENFTLNNPEKTGYTFKGWSGTELTGDTNKTVTISKGSTGNRTYTANWDINNYYLNINGLLDGNLSETLNDYGVVDVYINDVKVATEVSDYNQQLPYGTTYEIKNIKETSGHIYDGVSSGSLTGTIENENVTVDLEFTTYVPEAYTITYDLKGGTVRGNPTKYTIESDDIILVNPTRTGYTFKGWSGTELTGDTNETVTISKGSTGNRTYTANWTKNTYTITYNLNGGSVSPANPTTYNIESNDITLTNPKKEGYKFLGWTGSNGTTKQTTVKISKGSTGNKSYTANWRLTQLTIKYNCNEGWIMKNSPIGNTTALTGNPCRTQIINYGDNNSLNEGVLNHNSHKEYLSGTNQSSIPMRRCKINSNGTKNCKKTCYGTFFYAVGSATSTTKIDERTAFTGINNFLTSIGYASKFNDLKNGSDVTVELYALYNNNDCF